MPGTKIDSLGNVSETEYEEPAPPPPPPPPPPTTHVMIQDFVRGQLGSRKILVENTEQSILAAADSFLAHEARINGFSPYDIRKTFYGPAGMPTSYLAVEYLYEMRESSDLRIRVASNFRLRITPFVIGQLQT
jgi:hypothetical protein